MTSSNGDLVGFCLPTCVGLCVGVVAFPGIFKQMLKSLSRGEDCLLYVHESSE